MWMRQAWVAAVVVLIPTLATAAGKIAVLDAHAVGMVEQKQIDGLSALVASELQSQTGYRVISGSEIRAMIGYEQQKQKLGCDDAGCLAEIGGALGADHIVSIEVSRIGSTWLLSMSMVESKTSQVEARVTQRREKVDDIVDAAVGSVGQLATMLPGARGTPQVATAAPESGSPVLKWSLVGAGAVAVAVAAVLVAGAQSTRSDFDASSVAHPIVSRADASSAETNSAVGVGLAAGGVAIALGSLLFVH
jgi:hypothetical protein